MKGKIGERRFLLGEGDVGREKGITTVVPLWRKETFRSGINIYFFDVCKVFFLQNSAFCLPGGRLYDGRSNPKLI